MGDRWRTDVVVLRPGVPSAAALWVARSVLHPLVRVLHRATLEGLEHLPKSGPYLLVANHSGGLGIAEINAFIALWARRFGDAIDVHPIAGFAHSAGFKTWPLTWIHPHLGTIPSTYDAAERALEAGAPILVFPGGDHETMRPIWQAHRVDFGGRKGFLRIAKKAGVPIVPMGIRGGHFTTMPLVRSRILPWLFVWPAVLGVKRYAITLSGVLGVAAILWLLPLAWPLRVLVAWAWAASPAALVPWIPWTIRMRIGAPLSPASLFRDDDLDAPLRDVESAVQSLVDRS